jgi:tellurite resistance protein
MARFRDSHSRYSEHARPAHTEAPREAQEALVEVMTIAACVDGMLEEGEADALKLQILATPGFENMDTRELSKTVEAVAVRVANEGLAGRVRAIAEAIGDDTHTREEAFALATLFVLFDGEVGDEEQEFLEVLQRELRISDDRASHITSVLADLE